MNPLAPPKPLLQAVPGAFGSPQDAGMRSVNGFRELVGVKFILEWILNAYQSVFLEKLLLPVELPAQLQC